MKKEILQLHADFCKIFSNATRLEILCLLRSGEMTVSELTEKLGIPKANALSRDRRQRNIHTQHFLFALPRLNRTMDTNTSRPVQRY